MYNKITYMYYRNFKRFWARDLLEILTDFLFRSLFTF